MQCMRKRHEWVHGKCKLYDLSFTFGTWQTVNMRMMTVMIRSVRCFWFPAGMALCMEMQAVIKMMTGTKTITTVEPIRL